MRESMEGVGSYRMEKGLDEGVREGKGGAAME